MEWPTLDLAGLFNMIIGAVLALSGVLLGDYLEGRRARRNEKWQELQHWRARLVELDQEAQHIDRTSLAMDYIYDDAIPETAMEKMTPRGPARAAQQARQVRRRVQRLAQELGIDPGLPRK